MVGRILEHDDRRDPRADRSSTWAWAIIHGGKDVENRSRRTRYRGPLLIHAGHAFESEGYEAIQRLASQPPPPAPEFIHGAIIGVVEVVDCIQGSHSEWAVAGQWHWLLRNRFP